MRKAIRIGLYVLVTLALLEIIVDLYTKKPGEPPSIERAIKVGISDAKSSTAKQPKTLTQAQKDSRLAIEAKAIKTRP